jgi:Xaa-Pro dipeptidase
VSLELAARPEIAFPTEEYNVRVSRLREQMERQGLDAVLVHTPRGQCYLTGFETIDSWGYRCLVVPREGDLVLAIIEMEEANVYLTSELRKVVLFRPGQNRVKQTADAIRSMGLGNGRLGVESDSLLAPSRFVELEEGLPDAKWVDATSALARVVLTKSTAEVAYIRRAAAITDLGIEAAFAAATEGKTDQDIAAAAYKAMIGAGSEYMCIQPVVTTGEWSGVPHSTHRRRQLRRRDPVFLEFGACIRRYSGPMMRTATIGAPRDDVRRTADVALAALDHVLGAIKAGATADEVASAGWRDIAKDRAEVFFHGVVAYSVGLGFPPNWADVPLRLLRGGQTYLEAGMVFHLPLACRDRGRYCVGFSETVVVTPTGCEVVGKYPRELVVL